MSQLLRKIEKRAREESNVINVIKHTIGITSTVITPIATAFLFIHIKSTPEPVFWFSIGLIVIIQALSLYLYSQKNALATASYFDALSIQRKHKDTHRKLQETHDDVDFYTRFRQICFSWAVMESVFDTEGLKTPDNLHNCIGVIMSQIIEKRNVLFGFDADDLWKFTVYLYDEKHDHLDPVWRELSDQHPAHGEIGRKLQKGWGHVGTCFARKQEIIENEPGNEKNALPDEKKRDYDDVYKSFIAIPIGPLQRGNSQEIPYGVIAVTTNNYNKFLPMSHEIIVQASVMIANLIHRNILNKTLKNIF